jgi:Rad3-related DNA helicase
MLKPNNNITDFFPFSSYRLHQKETIEKIQEFFDKGIKDIIIEMPTGSGKSPVAIACGLWSTNAYCLTSQKILQDQYVRDFTEDSRISVLKGRGNYECTFLGAPTMCNECYESARKDCYKNGTCLYQIAKMRTAGAQVAMMNYAYLLSVVECDPKKTFTKRKLLILDEAHCIESEVLNFIEFLLSEYMFKRVGYPVNIPSYDTLDEYHKWIKENVSIVNNILVSKTKELNNLNNYRVNLNRDSHQFKKLSGEASELVSQIDEVDRLYRRMNKFLNTLNDVEWIFTIEKTEKLKMKRIVFRPLTINLFAGDSLLNLGEHRIYLSATILDKNSFCRSLGINADEAQFVRTPSTFPAENRKIFFANSGYMNLNKIQETLPNIVTDLNKALDYHREERGLVHCHSYKIANYIRDNCNNDRLIFHDSESREKMLSKFLSSKTASVLVSPSMTEGLDLKDDLARWEVIVKIPHLYIGDKQIARRMQIDPDWYTWQTCLTLVQSYGRIFRSEEDWGTAYIFDSSAKWFIKKNKDILPDWFIEACKF